MDTPRAIGELLRSQWFGLAARAVLTLPYWTSGVFKLFDLPGAVAEAEGLGLHPAPLIVLATVIVQLTGSALLIVGRWAWLAAGALGIFTAIATLIAHRFWEISDLAERFHVQNTFLEHVGLVGGLILAAIVAERERHA